MAYPPQDLGCPDPSGCPVIDVANLPAHLPTATVAVGTRLYRVYDGKWGYDEPNPGFGDARFSPFDAADGHRVPTLYLAQSPSAALLETVFHDVHHASARLVYERDLQAMLLAHVESPAALTLADLRDPVLATHGIDRSALAASPAEHYPCTRRIAQHLYDHGAGRPPVQGIVWHSRQAELHAAPPAEVMVVFTDVYPADRGGWVRIGPGSQNLFEGPGRVRVAELALALGATVVTSGP